MRLKDEEIDIIEKVLDKQTVWMFTKVWNERRGLQPYKKKIFACLEECRKTKKVETRYWEEKVKEIKLVEDHQTRIIKEVVDALEGKVEPLFYEKILKATGFYVEEKP